jgi:catechol 2,3-dioxygenase-like lactoylglutathione lyase family enzyme
MLFKKRWLILTAAVTSLIFFDSSITYAQTKNAMNKIDSTIVSVRYIVNNVEQSVAFYRDLLGFEVKVDANPGFAMLAKGNLRLLFNKPGAGGAGQSMSDGEAPKPGGWNRIQFEVEDLEAEIKRLKKLNAKFRNEIIIGNAGKQILLEDPSGNLVELFESNR